MPEKPDEDLQAEIIKFLHYHKMLGINHYPRTPMLERFLSERHNEKPAVLKRETESSREVRQKHVFDQGLAAKATLDDVREELGECQRCPLKKTRTNIVFGQGPASAKLMLVADAPGRVDDRQGIPFQGEAGELLDKMLAAIDLSRDDVYLTTLVKCFPGDNARPRANEIKTCLPFLFRQIEIICPAIICTMGMLGSQNLLHSGKSLFQLRGRFYNFNDLCSSQLDDSILVMPSLHPSLLLENSDLKKASWQDLQLIQKKLAR